MADLEKIESLVRASKEARLNDELLETFLEKEAIKERLQWYMQKSAELCNIFDAMLDAMSKVDNQCSHCAVIRGVLTENYTRYKLDL